MPFYHSNGLKYYRFPLFEGHGVIHAALTRQGGTSPSPWDSLNLGGTVGDDSARVFENRQRAFEAVQLSFDSLFDVWQVHSDRVVVANAPRLASEAIQQADAILTNKPDVTLFMRFADCVPVYLYDPLQASRRPGPCRLGGYHQAHRRQSCQDDGRDLWEPAG